MTSRSDNKNQKYYKCSCELFIEDFKVSHAGYLYFIWVSGNKQTQTLKYDTITSTSVEVSQNLSLNLKLCSKNGKFVQKSTNLYLLNEQGDELDDIQLNVNEWPASFKEMNFPIGGGSIHAKVRRKQIMEVGNMEDESDEGMDEVNPIAKSAGRMKITEQHDQIFRKSQQRSFYISKNQKSFISGQMNSQSQSHSPNDQLLEQLAITKKQLQDNVYLNNKLKNDRDVLMKKQQSLEIQIQTILVTTSQQIKKLREHYDKRISLRQSIYEEEIEEMIVMINGNSDYSRKVIEQLLRQKAKTDDENKLMVNELKKANAEINMYKEKYEGDLQFLNAQLARKIEEHQKEKDEQARKIQEELKRKEKQVESIKIQILRQKSQMQNQLQVYKAQFQKSRINNQSLEDQLMQQVKKNQEKSMQIQERVQQIQKATSNIRTLAQMLEQEQKLIAQLKGQVQQLKAQAKNTAQQLVSLNAQLLQKTQKVTQLEAQLQQITYELQFNQDAHKQLKVQHQEKQQQLYNQLQNIEAIYNDKMQQYARKLHEKIQEMNREINELREKLGLSEKQLSEYQEQLVEKESEILNIKESQRGSNDDQDERVKLLETEKEAVKKDFQTRFRKMEEQMKRRDAQLAQRIRELQDQLHITSKKKDQSEIKVREYERQLENIKATAQRAAINNDPKSQKQIPLLMNRSVQLSQPPSMEMSRQEITLGQALNTGQLQRELARKQEQIHRLNNRIEELTKWCSSLELKMKDTQGMKLVEYCESEKNEEENINRDEKKRKTILDDLEMIDKMKNSKSPEKNGVGGQNMILDEANFGYTPKNASYLKRRQSMGMSKQLSEHSNTSYIRVSHNKKITEQQKLIKEFQEREEKYKKQIEGYTKQINELTKEIEKIRHEMEEYLSKPPIGQSTLNEMQGLRMQAQSSKQQLQGKIALTIQLKQQLSQLKPQLQHLRSLKPQLQQQLKQSTKNLQQTKQSLLQLQLTLKDTSRQLQQSQQSQKSLLTQQQNLSKLITQLQQKIRQGKQHQQQLRMQNRELMFVNEQTTNEMKKYKLGCEELEDKVKKYAGCDVTIKELQKEVEEWNRKGLEQVRVYNHLKLEKDSLQQEMKLVKKRQGEQTRAAIEWEEKAAGLQRIIDQYKRKQAKFKRQIEQAQQQTRKTRNQSKKLQQQLHTLQTLSTSFAYQKKKLLDQLAQKGDQLTRKQYQHTRLLKQLQKYRHKIEESEDNRLGRKNELRAEIERLEGDGIKKDKRILQMEEELKLMRGRLEFLQKENAKIMDKKTQTYGDKLKHYVDEIASIKKLLDQYQAENTKLKLQNNEFYEENQLLKLSFSKLQKKYQQNIDNEENILTDLQHYMDEYNAVSDKNRQYELQLDRLQQGYLQVKKQLDQQKVAARKRQQKLQSAEKTNGILMDEIKQLKVKLSQLQTETKISHNIGEKYKNLDRKKCQIQDQLKKVKQQYDSYRNTFAYKEDDVQKLCQQIRATERKQKELEMNAAIDEITRTHNMKTTKFEAELLDMFNQNSKIREELNLKSQELAKTRLQLSELDTLTNKLVSAENQIKQLTEELSHMKEQLKRKNDKASKDQVYIKELETRLQSKQVELVDAITRVNDLQMKLQKLNNKISMLQQNQQALQDKIRTLLQKQKQAAQQKVQSLQLQSGGGSTTNLQQPQQTPFQQLQRRAFQLQLQLAKSKQKQSSLTSEYTSKIKSLQQKLQQMSQTMTQHQRQLQKHYQDELYKSEESIIKLSEELEDKLIRIDQLNQAIIVLQHQNETMGKDLEGLRYKLDQETEIFNLQYNKLKQKLKDSEEIYNKNLKSLQDQLTSMGKQLTLAKYAKNSDASGSRLKGSQVDDSRKQLKRAQQKLKTKQKKIQQLKSNIYILQQTVLKLRKKQSTADQLTTQLQTLRTQNTKLTSSLQQKQKRHESQLKALQSQVKELRQQLLGARQGEETAKISLEEKLMEMGSMEAELRTVKELYAELQREIDRRKVSLASQIQEESLVVVELRSREVTIAELRQKLQQLTMSLASSQAQCKKLLTQNKSLTSQLKQANNKTDTLSKQYQQLQSSKTFLKQQLTQLKQQTLTMQTQAKTLRSQLQKAKRFNQQSRSQLAKAYQQLQKSSNSQDYTSSRLKQLEAIAIRYRQLDEISQKELGVNLDQLIQEGYFMQTLQQKENEINQLIEENEELKFMADRKLLDYDELKRENYELALKAEDAEMLNEQVDNLRKICDKLEEEKKQATFREELIKMHLGNMLQSSDRDDQYKRKIQTILRSVASVGQLGGVSFGESSFGNY